MCSISGYVKKPTENIIAKQSHLHILYICKSHPISNLIERKS